MLNPVDKAITELRLARIELRSVRTEQKSDQAVVDAVLRRLAEAMVLLEPMADGRVD